MILTSGEIINAAMRKCGGILASGETPSADESADILQAFNSMLDSWSAERLSVFSTQDQIFTWPANTLSRTIGPSGDLSGNRPQKVDDSTYFKDPGTGISYGLEIVNEEQYNAIALKTVTSTYPQLMHINMNVPDITVELYPVPTQDLEFHFISITELAQLSDLVTDVIVPPGYMRAFIYNLACEICMEFGLEPPASTQRLAMASKRVLKANNSPQDIMALPASLLGKQERFNIFSGNY
jgi:hypothetical protein